MVKQNYTIITDHEFATLLKNFINEEIFIDREIELNNKIIKINNSDAQKDIRIEVGFNIIYLYYDSKAFNFLSYNSETPISFSKTMKALENFCSKYNFDFDHEGSCIISFRKQYF